MNIVNVATLKERLSYFLSLAKQGQEVTVTSHKHEIARIVPISREASLLREPSRPMEHLRRIKGIKPEGSPAAVEMLLADRRRR